MVEGVVSAIEVGAEAIAIEEEAMVTEVVDMPVIEGEEEDLEEEASVGIEVAGGIPVKVVSLAEEEVVAVEEGLGMVEVAGAEEALGEAEGLGVEVGVVLEAIRTPWAFTAI
jgi:hypothetical protein